MYTDGKYDGQYEQIQRDSSKPAGCFTFPDKATGDHKTRVFDDTEKFRRSEVETQNNEFDKNTPGSLKNLRWSIYELIERYEGHYAKTISGILRQGVEELFQKYTNS
jgi:hypothetical protein